MFCCDPIRAGDVIERCPLLTLRHVPEQLDDYCVRVPDDENFPVALPLGFGSLYNHSRSPRTVWAVIDQVMTVTAIDDIPQGEEILISYGPTWFSARNRHEIS